MKTRASKPRGEMSEAAPLTWHGCYAGSWRGLIAVFGPPA